MNTKQIATLPAIAAAPSMIIGGAIFIGGIYLLEWLFPDNDAENKQRTAPASGIPKNVLVVPKASVPAVQKISTPAPIPAVPISEDLPPRMPSQKRRIVLREDLAQIFQHGARSLYRIDAVTELQKLEFCKTAAYEALSPVGKFASRLQIAPDGVISWKS